MIDRRVIWALVVVPALYACFRIPDLARSEEMDPLSGILIADVVTGVLCSLVLDARQMFRLELARSARDRAVARAYRRGMWPPVLVVTVHVILGWALFPLTYDDVADRDLTWFPTMFVALGLGGLMAALLGYLISSLTLVPLMMLPGAVMRALHGDRTSRRSAWFAGLMLSVVPLAVSLVLATGEGARGLGRAFLVIIGQRAPLNPTAIWFARGTLVVFVLLLVQVAREASALRREVAAAQQSDGAQQPPMTDPTPRR